MEKKYKVKLNSIEKVESILQEVYDDSMRQLTLIQNKINELEQSTNLSEEPIDMKAKYAKAMHDYITDKEKAIGRKLDVSKLMSEILKQNGDVEKVLSDKDIMGNLDDAFAKAREHADNIGYDTDTDKTETYITNKTN
jgi:hypothetical protein